MKIEVCTVAGFGSLGERTFPFREGLNVLCLPNGAGKSTLAGFIKCMLYGLSDTKKQNPVENERKRFAPLGGRVFGGSMTFSTSFGRFTVERTFGKKSSEDTFALYDAETGKRSGRYTDPIGEAIFGVDADAFERVFYLSERELTGKNESVAERLASPTEKAGLSDGLGSALDRLEAERRRLSRRGGGEIENTEQKIAALTVEIRELRGQANCAAEIEKALSDVKARIDLANAAPQTGGASEKERARALAALKAEEAELLTFFRAGIPTTEEIRSAEHTLMTEKAPSPTAVFAKKMRPVLFLLSLALGALGVAIGLSYSVFGYLLLLPAVFPFFRFLIRKNAKKGKNSLQAKKDALSFLAKYPCKTTEPFEEIRKKLYRIEEVRRAIGARENEEYEKVTSPPSPDALYREQATLEGAWKSAESAAFLLEEKEREYAELKDRLGQDKTRLSLLLKAKELLMQADERLAGTYLTRISDGLLHYGAMLGEKTQVAVDSDLCLSGRKGGLSLPLDVMSRGERALAKLALRLSLADALGGSESPFFLLDDPFLAFDDEGIGRAMEALHTLGEERQILYFTCSASRVP